MTLFWFFALTDLIAATILIGFFIVGLGDGSVSSYNASLWLLILSGTAAIIGGGFVLKSRGRIWPANFVLMVLAIPALLYGLIVLVMVINPPDFR